MIAAEPISRLAESLQRLRNGKADDEVIRWLRALTVDACNVPQPQASGSRYTRSLIHKNERFEILVMHWMPGCSTPIHDHGGTQCWFAVCNGAMIVENYLRRDSGRTPGYAHIELEGREMLETGSIDERRDDLHLHRCVAGPQPVTTLHVYATPLGHFNTFDLRAQTYAPACSTYDAILAS